VIRYDAICQAIAAVVEVDEVKPIRDQILVLQLYAEQARIIPSRAGRQLGKCCSGWRRRRGTKMTWLY
jgi:hypothetical protein